MKPMICTTEINAPIEAVFAAITDFANAPQRVKGITRVEMLTDGPVGVGTKFKETRMMFKRESTETMEVTAYDPPHRIELSADSCGMAIRSEFVCTSAASGTRLDITMNATAKTFFTKLMSPLAGLMAGAMKKCVMGDLADIKAGFENAPSQV